MKMMNKEIFDKILDDNDITWNDIVIIGIYNPFRRHWYQFYEPRILFFKGALNYTIDSQVVHVEVYDETYKSVPLFFDFNEIISIKKYEA